MEAIDEKKPTKQDRLIVNELDDEVLLFDPEGDVVHRLNVSASLIWHQCDGRRSLADIAQELTEQYDVEFDQALCDARKVLLQLEQRDLVSFGMAT